MRRLRTRDEIGLAAQGRPRRNDSGSIVVRYRNTQNLSERDRVWCSRYLDLEGYTLAVAFIALRILIDSGPAGDFALMANLASLAGSGSSFGPAVGMGQGFAGMGKLWTGPGLYNLELSTPAAGAGQALANQCAVELWAIGGPAGRTMAVSIDAVMVAGGAL